MNKEKIVVKKLFLLKKLLNNIENKLPDNSDKIINEIKLKLAKLKNKKIVNKEKNEKIPKFNTNSINSLAVINKKDSNINDRLIIYIDRYHINENAKDIIKKWCKSINVDNYKIINNHETLNLEIKNNKPKAILSCEEINFFLNQTLRIQIIRGLELRFKKIPIVFTYLPSSQTKNPELKKDIWEDLKVIKGIIKYG